ncbi:MAG: hypothetical protein D6695_02530 [Planctomycetota bacterium]|nr:MAG: hypothetical protein D6695_02530 [Planctomycetota bacterium]
MDEVKPWQLAVVIIGLLGGLGLLAWNLFGGEKIDTPDELVLMDVITGDRFIADVSGRKGVILPAKNPDTQQYTLLPIAKGEDGTWRVHHLDQIVSLKPEELKAIEDLQTGVARPSEAPPRRLKN